MLPEIAAAGTDPGFPTWVSSAGSLAILAAVVGMWLGGLLVRRADHQAALEAANARASKAEAEAEAWHEAHDEQARARRALEAANGETTASTEIALRLLSAFETVAAKGTS